MQPDHDTAEAGGPIDAKAIKVYLDNLAAFKAFLRRRLPSDEAAEDLLQQSLLKAIRKPDSMADKENATAWFYRILRNSLTDFYRARAAEGRKEEGLLNELMASGADREEAPDAELMQEACACINRLLPALKPEYAEMVQRIDLGGEEPAAVAESAGITYNNLMVRLHRARRALRKSLEDSCGACTRHGCLNCTCEAGPVAGKNPLSSP